MLGNLLINANQVNPMLPDCIDFLIKRFENPDEVRTFEKGQFELIKIGGMTIGRATYEPGWRWSQHVAPVAGTSLCQVDRKSTRLNSSHSQISYAVFCL